jgi:heterodisulfide reductase subunit A
VRVNPQDVQVAIVGAGVAGLAAADEIARWGVGTALLESGASVGGHAARFSCKALGECATCGACLANERRLRVANKENVSILTDVRITAIQRGNGFAIRYQRPDALSPSGVLKADVLLLTTGFEPYDPSDRPYGYGRFPNVLTLLGAEERLRRFGHLTCPSDGQPPAQIAFIQCVGSRDSRIGHPWCSKICCGAALRMARLIQHRRPQTAVTFFYIDVQTFGKNFQRYYNQTCRQVRMVRAIPGDIVQTEAQGLQLAYFDPDTRKAMEEPFDLVVLSTGITPNNADLAGMLALPLADTGFFLSHERQDAGKGAGIFTAGAALGPMSIAESIDSAGKAAWDLLNYLKINLMPKT